MLIIRDPQKKELGNLAEAGFRTEMLAHLEAHAPVKAQAMGTESLEDFIAQSILYAGQYEITQRDNLQLWLELSLLWGIGFMNDPTYDFAQECILLPENELERMQMLHQNAVSHAIETCGNEGEFFLAALKRIEALYELEAKVPPNFTNRMILDQLNYVWPERAHRTGEHGMLQLVQRGNELANQKACSGFLGSLVCSLLVFLLGYQCDSDPQYRWFWNIKKDSRGKDNTSALISRSKAYLKEAQGS